MARPLFSVLKDWVTFSNASPKATKEKSLVIQLLVSLFGSFGVYLHVAKTRKRSGNQRVCRITEMLLQRTELHDLVETSLLKQEGVLVPFMAHVKADEIEPPELLVTSTSYLIPFRRNPSCGGPCTIYAEVVDVDGLKEFLCYANRDLEHAKAACANADVELEGKRQRDIIKKKAQVEHDRFRGIRGRAPRDVQSRIPGDRSALCRWVLAPKRLSVDALRRGEEESLRHRPAQFASDHRQQPD